MKPVAKAHEIAARFTARLGKVPPLFAKKAESTRGSLYLYDVIGADYYGGISAQMVVDALAALKKDGCTALDLFINSPGGDVFEAKAIVANLQRFEGEKVVYVDGVAASAATFIAMVGDRIVTSSMGTWMVHEASCFAFGRAADMRAMADVLDMQNQDMAAIYARQTGKTVEEMLAVMNAETWMSAQEALDAGFTDEVSKPEEAAPAPAEAKAPPLAIAAALTEERVRHVREARRLEQLSNRASPGSTSAASRTEPTRSRQ